MNQVTHWKIPQDHPAFAGHFVDMPILPGVILIDVITQLLADANLIDITHYQINSIKFLSPARPGDALSIEYEVSSKGSLNFNILVCNRKIATGSIISATQI